MKGWQTWPVRFMQGMQRKFNLQKPVERTHHVPRIKGKNWHDHLTWWKKSTWQNSPACHDTSTRWTSNRRCLGPFRLLGWTATQWTVYNKQINGSLFQKLEIQLSREGSVPGHRLFLYLHRPGVRELCGISFTKALILFLRAPLSCPNHLPKAPTY